MLKKNVSWLIIEPCTVFMVYAFHPNIVACFLILFKIWRTNTHLWAFLKLNHLPWGHFNFDIYYQFIFRHTYSTTGENNELMNLEHHKKACRALKFSSDGIHLYTASKDKSIQVIDLNTGSVKQKLKGAHKYNSDMSWYHSSAKHFSHIYITSKPVQQFVVLWDQIGFSSVILIMWLSGSEINLKE